MKDNQFEMKESEINKLISVFVSQLGHGIYISDDMMRFEQNDLKTLASNNVLLDMSTLGEDVAADTNYTRASISAAANISRKIFHINHVERVPIVTRLDYVSLSFEAVKLVDERCDTATHGIINRGCKIFVPDVMIYLCGVTAESGDKAFRRGQQRRLLNVITTYLDQSLVVFSNQSFQKMEALVLDFAKYWKKKFYCDQEGMKSMQKRVLPDLYWDQYQGVWSKCTCHHFIFSCNYYANNIEDF